MAEYMHECYSSFDMFDQGIQTGTSIPQSVSLYAEGATQGTITDEDAIVELWNALSEVRIDLEHRQNFSYEGRYISFSFDSGKELIPFPFSTVELAKFDDDEFTPWKTPTRWRGLWHGSSSFARQTRRQADESQPLGLRSCAQSTRNPLCIALHSSSLGSAARISWSLTG
jgi:hypothetical protein